MEPYKIVLDTLEGMNISYKLVEHPSALTMEEADAYIEGIEGVRTKTLFICNKKSRAFYLIVMDEEKQLDMKKLEEMLSDKGLHFCSAEKLMDKLGLIPGMVSLFGILNNKEKDVNVIFDEEMTEESPISFFANDSTKTVFISSEDMLRFTKESGFEYKIMRL